MYQPWAGCYGIWSNSCWSLGKWHLFAWIMCQMSREPAGTGRNTAGASCCCHPTEPLQKIDPTLWHRAIPPWWDTALTLTSSFSKVLFWVSCMEQQAEIPFISLCLSPTCSLAFVLNVHPFPESTASSFCGGLWWWQASPPRGGLILMHRRGRGSDAAEHTMPW